MEPELALTPLPGGTWSMLSLMAVRTTGFPADLLGELVWAEPADDADLFYAELRRTSKAMARISGLESFREALAWQNPGTLATFESLARTAGDARRNAKRRWREYLLVRYITRYCGKTETIGFFGPLGWGRLTGDSGHIRQRPGAALVSLRKTFAEPWAVRALAAALMEDPEIASWMPVRTRSHYTARDGLLYRPRAEPVPLSELEWTVVRLCDGERPRRRIVEEVATALGLEHGTVDACITALEHRRDLVSGPNLPLGPGCLIALEARLSAIADGPTAERARARTVPFVDALRALAAAHGDANAVAEAQARLGAIFQESTGTEATRRNGRMYAGRGVAYEECLRDLEVTAGTDFMERVNEALPGILAMSQWLTWETATAYEEHFRRAWSAKPRRRLDTVWFELMGAFFGGRHRPIDDVMAEFRGRWRRLVEQLHASAAGWTFDPGEFHDAVARLFPSPGSGWPGGAIHSPDLQLVSYSRDGTRTGDYGVVLSELHMSVQTVEGPIFEWCYNDYPISRFIRSRTGPGVVPVFPDSWPRNTGRAMPAQPLPEDICFAFADVDGAPRDTIGMTGIEVEVAGGSVAAVLPDGARMPFREFFSFFLSAVVMDAWKGITDGPYTPRISVGRFTIVRETWRVDVAGEPFTRPTGEFEAYRAADAWRRSLGFPDRVYVKLNGEVKPFYVDFSSPISVLSFLSSLRATLRQPNSPTEITLSEALPEPHQAWVVDGAGSTYFGEIRMTVMDDRGGRG